MDRRQFIGASLGGLIAALVLPFQEFAEWWKRWLGVRAPVTDAFLKAKMREIDALWEQLGDELSEHIWGRNYGAPLMSLNPVRLQHATR